MTVKQLTKELLNITKQMEVTLDGLRTVKVILYRRESNVALKRYIKNNDQLKLISSTQYIPPVVSKYYAIYRIQAL